MHVTVARINHELAQWQSERAAQDDKIDSPAGKAAAHRGPSICRPDFAGRGVINDIW
jgi:hypothetical protein